VKTRFSLIKRSSGQHSEIWGTTSAYHVLWDPILLNKVYINKLQHNQHARLRLASQTPQQINHLHMEKLSIATPDIHLLNSSKYLQPLSDISTYT